MRRGVESATSATLGLATITSRASTGSSTIADFPRGNDKVRTAEAPTPTRMVSAEAAVRIGMAMGAPASVAGA